MSFLKTAFLALALCLAPGLALAESALTDAQKAEVEAVVRELLTKKEPEIIIKAAEIVQGKIEKETAQKGAAEIAKNIKRLESDPLTPVGGNPKGDVTVVQFFDYSCGYCKMAQGHLQKLLDEDKNVRLVYKEFAILGPASQKAAEMALASVEQGKYIPFHTALMEAKKRLSEEEIYKIAESVGLNVEKLKKDAQASKVKESLADNLALADSIGVRGTPSFIIGGKLYPGALSIEQLKQAVAAARKPADKK